MASMLDRLLAADISDPTDFPDNASAPGLRSFDDAVRCNICRDFYDAPVTLTCGHCFCSACIRSALPEHQTCPTCRKPASEVHIRKDIAMETAVQAWQAARPYIVQLAREEEARKAQPARPPHSHCSSNERRIHKRRRLESPPAGSDSDVQIIPSSPAPSGSSVPATSDTPTDLVSCPSCQRDVPFDTINAHLDSECKQHLGVPNKSTAIVNGTRSKQKQQWNSLFRGAPSASAKGRSGKEKEFLRSKGKTRATPDDDDELEHLPKVAYDIHPQKRIADMLAEWDLPTQGEKAALVRRHKRWVVLYNANVDRAPSHRRTLDQLRADLKLEEAEQGAKGRGKETVDDTVAYQRANKAAFAKLTEAARPKKREHADNNVSLSVPTTSASLDERRLCDPGDRGSRLGGNELVSPTGDEVIDIEDES